MPVIGWPFIRSDTTFGSTLLGALTEDRDIVIDDLEKAAGNSETVIQRACANSDVTGTEQNQHGCVAVQYAELSVPARGYHLFG